MFQNQTPIKGYILAAEKCVGQRNNGREDKILKYEQSQVKEDPTSV